jgi:hypothetical protein
MYTNATGYNKRLISTFYISHFIRRELMWIIVSALALFGIGSMFREKTSQGMLYLGIGSIIYLVFVLVLAIVFLKMNVNKKLKNGVNRLNYVFNEKDFLIYCVVDDQEVSQKVPYKEIKKLVRYKYVIMFYYSWNHAFIMDANGFTVGNYEQLRVLLEREMN